MRLHTLQYIAGALLVFMISACYKDLGNYDYADTNEVVILGLEKYYTALQGKYLEITPRIGATDPAATDSARYKYEWIAMKDNALTADKRKDLGTNKGLRMVVTLSPGKYDVYYRVKDTLTGVQFQQSFKLEVTSLIYEGWMSMVDVNGTARVDMISKLDDQWTVQPDILNVIKSGLTLKGKPVGISCFRQNPLANGYAIFMMTDQTTERIDAETFEYKSTMNIKYEMLSNVPEDFAPTMISTAQSGFSYMIEGTDVYFYDYTSQIRYSLPVNNLRGESKTFRIAPMMALNAEKITNMTAFYDLDNKRFVRHINSEPNLSVMPKGVNDTLFDYNLGMDPVYMTYTPFANGNVVAVMHDPATGKYFLVRFAFKNTTSQVAFKEITGTDIAQATKFAVSPDYGYLLYSVGGKLYSYELSLGTNKLMLDYGSEVISALQFRNAELGVASYDPSRPDAANGKLEVFTVQPVQGPLTLLNSWKGIGKPVSIAYRTR